MQGDCLPCGVGRSSKRVSVVGSCIRARGMTSSGCGKRRVGEGLISNRSLGGQPYVQHF